MHLFCKGKEKKKLPTYTVLSGAWGIMVYFSQLKQQLLREMLIGVPLSWCIPTTHCIIKTLQLQIFLL